MWWSKVKLEQNPNVVTARTSDLEYVRTYVKQLAKRTGSNKMRNESYARRCVLHQLTQKTSLRIVYALYIYRAPKYGQAILPSRRRRRSGWKLSLLHRRRR